MNVDGETLLVDIKFSSLNSYFVSKNLLFVALNNHLVDIYIGVLVFVVDLYSCLNNFNDS